VNPEDQIMPSNNQPTPEVPVGWPVEPEYVRPSWMPAPRDAPYQPYGAQQQPTIINNYYGPQQAARRGPDAGQVLGWVAVGGIVAGVLLAVATVAIALGLAALAMAIMALVLRAIWRDFQKRG
jgi:hypothetical protein